MKNPLDVTQAPVLISGVNAATQSTGYAFTPSFGSDGRRVAFNSSAPIFQAI